MIFADFRRLETAKSIAQRRKGNQVLGSKAHGAKRKALGFIYRRPTLTYADEDICTAETQRSQRNPFLFVGRDDKQKHVSIADNNLIKILKRILNR